MPQVSIIIPCYNEQAKIRLLLDSLYDQTFPRQEIEVIIADGMSTDETIAVITAWGSKNPDMALRIVENLKRAIPSGLNRAIESATGDFIVRLDAHSMPSPDYVERSVSALVDRRGDNVGGLWKIKPGGLGFVAHSIAVAAAHPLGVGGAQYRVGGKPQAVDTVPFGAFRRDLVELIGLFDETLLSNEDYEYNARIRKAGGVVWFDPKIQSTYFARTTYMDLFKQYWRYGYWKFQMLRRYPKTIRWRQGLPPLLVLSICGLGLLSFWFSWSIWLLMLEILLYCLALLLVGLQMGRKHANWKMLVGVPLAISTMHFSWGTGFLWSILVTIFGRME